MDKSDIENSFSQREIQNYFNKIVQRNMIKVSDEAFVKIKPMYTKFLELNMEDILHQSMRIFDTYTIHMSKTSQKEIWKKFLENTVINYIQCLLNSTPKIKSKS